MAEGDSAKRSRLDADQVTNILREQGVANLRAKLELELVQDEMERSRLAPSWQKTPSHLHPQSVRSLAALAANPFCLGRIDHFPVAGKSAGQPATPPREFDQV